MSFEDTACDGVCDVVDPDRSNKHRAFNADATASLVLSPHVCVRGMRHVDQVEVVDQAMLLRV